MGNKISNKISNKNYTLDGIDKYILNFDSTYNNAKLYNIKPTKVKKSNNVKYVYFKISNMACMEIINKHLELYISIYNTDTTITQDKVNKVIKNDVTKNKIKNNVYNDIKVQTELGNYIIIRYNLPNIKNFQIIYVDSP